MCYLQIEIIKSLYICTVCVFLRFRDSYGGVLFAETTSTNKKKYTTPARQYNAFMKNDRSCLPPVSLHLRVCRAFTYLHESLSADAQTWTLRRPLLPFCQNAIFPHLHIYCTYVSPHSAATISSTCSEQIVISGIRTKLSWQGLVNLIYWKGLRLTPPCTLLPFNLAFFRFPECLYYKSNNKM